jgi:hypothetical protein
VTVTVGRPDPEGVLAFGEPGEPVRRRTGEDAPRVHLALEARPRLAGGEAKGRRGVVGGVRRGGDEHGLGQYDTELLDPVVEAVGHVDVSLRVDRDGRGKPEPPVARAVASPLGDEGARGVELLDPVVALVGDVDLSQREWSPRVDRDPVGMVELSVARSLAPPRSTKAPDRLNFWTRSLPRSVTKTVSKGPIATPMGLSNWPLPEPPLPHAIRKSPKRRNRWTRPLS